MSKEKENRGLVPKLRFQEFERDGEWELKKLIKCLLQKPEYGIGAPAVPYSEKLPTYLRITDISEDGRFINSNKVSVGWDISSNNYLNVGDIVFARTGASVGKAYKYRVEDGKLVFAGFLIRIKPNPSKIVSELLFQYVFSEQYWKWVNFTSARSGQPGINGKEYSSMPIILPPTLIEQQKIASCLSSLDDLITAETEKLFALQDHKTGLLQQLFPAEGETVPRLRFPEFEGEWTQTFLGEVSNILRGGSPRPIKKYLTKDKNSLNWLKIGDVDKDSKYIVKTEEKIKNSAIKKTREVKEGDLIMSNSMSFGRPYILKITTCIHDGWIAVTEIIQKITTNFLYYQILSSRCQYYFLNAAAGGGIKNLNAEIIRHLPIVIPKLGKEQQKIASCLSSLDDLIEAQFQKIEVLKDHKKGLMQQLFPEM